MIAHTTTLHHALHPGWFAPHVEALMAGDALGRRCAACERVSFPPLRLCPCGGAEGTWQLLSGAARIVWRTTGTDGDFALASFEGASALATVRLVRMPAGGTRGRLAAPEGGLPRICLAPLPEEGP
jgi:hypothetical protein